MRPSGVHPTSAKTRGEQTIFFFYLFIFGGVIPYCEPSSLNTHVTVAWKRLGRGGGGVVGGVHYYIY